MADKPACKEATCAGGRVQITCSTCAVVEDFLIIHDDPSWWSQSHWLCYWGNRD